MYNQPEEINSIQEPEENYRIMQKKYEYYCIICDRFIHSAEPRIVKNDKHICANCAMELLQDIYFLDGCGGMQIIIFQTLLKTPYLRIKRIGIPQYKKTLEKLKHKYNFKCIHCGILENLTIDHIIPVSKGGLNIESNYQLLCKSCNSKKGNKI